jgi:hypothetical protein
VLEIAANEMAAKKDCRDPGQRDMPLLLRLLAQVTLSIVFDGYLTGAGYGFGGHVASRNDERNHSRGADTPEFCLSSCLPWMRRAQGMPDAQRTRSLVCKGRKAHELETTGTPKHSGIPCAMVYGLYVLSPVYRAC